MGDRSITGGSLPPGAHLLEPTGTMDRRELIRRGVIAGGLAWAAPQVIRSTVGYATTVIGTPRPCTTYYAVRLTRECCSPLFPEGVRWPPKWDGTIVPEIIDWADDPHGIRPGFPSVCPQLTSAPATGPWSVLLPENPGPAAATHCRMVVGFSVAWECKPAGWPHCGPQAQRSAQPGEPEGPAPGAGIVTDGGGQVGAQHKYQPCPAGWGCEGYTDPNPPRRAERGRRLIFPQCRSLPIDEIQLIYCCP